MLRDVTDEALARGTDGIKASYDRFVAKGKLDAEDAEAALGRITTTTDLDAAAEADIVVEAVFETARGQAARSSARSTGSASDGAVLATNTSRHPDHPDRRGHRAARVRSSARTSSRRCR